MLVQKTKQKKHTNNTRLFRIMIILRTVKNIKLGTIKKIPLMVGVHTIWCQFGQFNLAKRPFARKSYLVLYINMKICSFLCALPT